MKFVVCGAPISAPLENQHPLLFFLSFVENPSDSYIFFYIIHFLKKRSYSI
jgi:hypothetical protein